MNCYGATETTSPSPSCPAVDRKAIDSVVALSGAQIIVVDGPSHEVPRARSARLDSRRVRYQGYWNNPKATTESFTAGFWHSGDLGSIDEANFVRVFDRQKTDQPRRPQDLFGRGRVGAVGPSRCAGERDHRKTLSGAGERVHAVVVVREKSAPRCCAAGVPNGCRTTSAGDHRPHHRAAAALTPTARC